MNSMRRRYQTFIAAGLPSQEAVRGIAPSADRAGGLLEGYVTDAHRIAWAMVGFTVQQMADDRSAALSAAAAEFVSPDESVRQSAVATVLGLLLPTPTN